MILVSLMPTVFDVIAEFCFVLAVGIVIFIATATSTSVLVICHFVATNTHRNEVICVHSCGASALATVNVHRCL